MTRKSTHARLATALALGFLVLALAPAAEARWFAAVEGCGGDGSCSSTRVSEDNDHVYADNDVNYNDQDCGRNIMVNFAVAGTSTICNNNQCIDDGCTAETKKPDPDFIRDGALPFELPILLELEQGPGWARDADAALLP